VAQEVEPLLCKPLLYKHKALSSNPNPQKKKKKKTVGFTVLFLQKNHYSRIILNFS
jgi:hypothetical protein